MNLISQKFTNPVVGNTLIGLEASEPSQFLSIFIPKFVGLIFVAGGVGFFLMFVWGAVTWILSGGDKAGVESAKNRISNALIGLILLIASIAIIKLIQKFFNINILSIDIGPLVIQ